MAEYAVLLSEEAAIERELLDRVQRRKLLWWGDRLARDPTAGDGIRKALIPRKLVRQYGIENLWRIELPGGWRALYTIVARAGVRPQVRILRILTHKEYGRILGYSTS